jgi:GT2 family glycosyltransferase
MTAGTASLDVVICTYNNAATLDAALAALGRQRGVDARRWSCLVVDNNCTDHTAAVVDAHRRAGRIAQLRSVGEPVQGLTPARLCGVRNTLAPWIAFVDDDCMVDPDWIASALGFADRHPDAGAFGGRIVLDFEREPANYVRNYAYVFAEQSRGDAERRVDFLAGAGLVANRAALTMSGWTESALLPDRTRRRLVSGGDVEIVLRIAAAGFDLWYVPACRLAHRIPAWRTTVRYLTAIARGLGASQSLADALCWAGDPRTWFRASTRRLITEVMRLGRLTLSVARGKSAPPEILIQSSFEIGRAQGILRVLRMPRRRRNGFVGCARVRIRGSASPTAAA